MRSYTGISRGTWWSGSKRGFEPSGYDNPKFSQSGFNNNRVGTRHFATDKSGIRRALPACGFAEWSRDAPSDVAVEGNTSVHFARARQSGLAFVFNE